MPIYLYRNLTTNETFELEQRITEPALTVDPTTGDPVKRLIQPVGIAVNTQALAEDEARTLLDALAAEHGLPATDPVRFGVEALVDRIVADFPEA